MKAGVAQGKPQRDQGIPHKDAALKVEALKRRIFKRDRTTKKEKGNDG